MSIKLKTAITAVTMTLALGSGSAVFAKAHDQGVADGEPTPDNTGAFVQTLDRGVSSVVRGTRGEAASAAKDGNSVTPTVGNGNNVEPD